MRSRFGTKFGPKRDRDGHTLVCPFSYSGFVMKGAFIIRLGPETKPKEGLYEGWVEEVDSDELLKFLGERYQAAFGLSRAKPEQRTSHPCDEDEP